VFVPSFLFVKGLQAVSSIDDVCADKIEVRKLECDDTALPNGSIRMARQSLVNA